MADIDILISATDQASSVLEDIKETGGTAASFLEDHWNQVGAAITGAAVALEANNRSMQNVRSSVYEFSTRLGVTRGEANDLVRSISDVTMGLDETAAVMTTGIRQSLKDMDDIKRYGEFWNLVGTASGESSSGLAEAAKAAGALGIDVKNITSLLPTFDYLLGATDISLAFFLRTMGMSAKELNQMQMSAHDLAIVMGYLEKHGFALPRAMMMKLRESMRESGGDFNVFLSNIGMSRGELETYRAEAEKNIGITEKLAEAHGESYTWLQRQSQMFAEIRLKYEGFTVSLGDAANAMLFFWLAIKAVKVVWAWMAGAGGVAVLAMLGKIALAAAAVALAIGSIVTIVKGLQELTKPDEIKKLLEEFELAYPKRKGETEEAYRKRFKEWLAWVHPMPGVMPPVPRYYRTYDFPMWMSEEDRRKAAEEWNRRVRERFPGMKPGEKIEGELRHSGTIKVEGVNSKGELVGAVDIVMARLRREMRGLA